MKNVKWSSHELGVMRNIYNGISGLSKKTHLTIWAVWVCIASLCYYQASKPEYIEVKPALNDSADENKGWSENNESDEIDVLSVQMKAAKELNDLISSFMPEKTKIEISKEQLSILYNIYIEKWSEFWSNQREYLQNILLIWNMSMLENWYTVNWFEELDELTKKLTSIKKDLDIKYWEGIPENSEFKWQIIVKLTTVNWNQWVLEKEWSLNLTSNDISTIKISPADVTTSFSSDIPESVTIAVLEKNKLQYENQLLDSELSDKNIEIWKLQHLLEDEQASVKRLNAQIIADKKAAETKLLEDLQTVNTDHQNKLTSMQTDYEKQKTSMVNEHNINISEKNAEIKKLKEDYDSAIAQSNAEHDNAIAKIKTRYDNQIKQLEDKFNSERAKLIQNIENLKRIIQNNNDSNNKEVSDLKSRIKVLEGQVIWVISENTNCEKVLSSVKSGKSKEAWTDGSLTEKSIKTTDLETKFKAQEKEIAELKKQSEQLIIVQKKWWELDKEQLKAEVQKWKDRYEKAQARLNALSLPSTKK